MRLGCVAHGKNVVIASVVERAAASARSLRSYTRLMQLAFCRALALSAEATGQSFRQVPMQKNGGLNSMMPNSMPVPWAPSNLPA